MSGRPAAGLLLAALLAACASTPERERDGGDRTGDPEFQAARRASERDYETQADALAAGVYEPFVHPDSVRPAAAGAAPAPAAATTPRLPGEPTTEELLGTLPPPASYNPGADAAAPPGARPPAAPAPKAGSGAGTWTLQLGAFDSETGARVRIRQLERDFPELPRWAAVGDVVRVFLGRYATREEAERARRAAVARGYADAWITRAP